MTSASEQRRNGLVAFSSAMVEGSVGCPETRNARASASRCLSFRLPGSQARAKRMLASVLEMTLLLQTPHKAQLTYILVVVLIRSAWICMIQVIHYVQMFFALL